MTDPEHAARINAAITQYEKELVAARVNAFLGGMLDEAAMATTIDPSLYRQRA